MTSIAIEGLCFAGKSTLAATLAERLAPSGVVVLPDYSDLTMVAERPFLPAPDPASELQALDYYLSIDALRRRSIQPTYGLVIQDRSLHTLLAHVYANDRLSGFNSFPSALVKLSTLRAADETDIVLYLDASQSTLRSRYEGIPNDLPALLTEPDYMRYFREYFISSDSSPASLAIIDADQPADVVADRAMSILRERMPC